MAAAEAKDSEGKEAFDDEERDFEIIAEAKITSPVSERKSPSFDLPLAAIQHASAGAKEQPLSEEDRILAMNSAPVRVLFDLPDGSQVESEFQMGHTVEVTFKQGVGANSLRHCHTG